MNCVYDAKDPRILVRNPHFLRDRKRGTCNTRQTRTEADIRVKMMPKTGLNGLFRAKYNPSCGFLVKLDLDLGSMEKRRSKKKIISSKQYSRWKFRCRERENGCVPIFKLGAPLAENYANHHQINPLGPCAIRMKID